MLHQGVEIPDELVTVDNLAEALLYFLETDDFDSYMSTVDLIAASKSETAKVFKRVIELYSKRTDVSPEKLQLLFNFVAEMRGEEPINIL